MENYNFYAPTRVLFGQGQLANLHTLPMPGKKAMIVTSNGQSTIKNGSLAYSQPAANTLSLIKYPPIL